jgi:hypothetical protein
LPIVLGFTTTLLSLSRLGALALLGAALVDLSSGLRACSLSLLALRCAPLELALRDLSLAGSFFARLTRRPVSRSTLLS